MQDVRWCLVLAIWGDKYSDTHVNVLLRAARHASPGLYRAVLFTDRPRPAVDAFAEQHGFPTFLDRPEFFTGGLMAKLAMFSRPDLPAGCRCLYLDLDTVVTGDLGQIVALVRQPGDYLMLPPANLVGFCGVRRLICQLSCGQFYAVGNSSVVAFHSGAEPNLLETYRALHASGHKTGPVMQVDDRFISRFTQARLRGVPRHLAVSFRRAFLARSRLALRVKSIIRRNTGWHVGLAAITLNGVAAKPWALLSLAEGDRIGDARGRFGYWSDVCLGPAKTTILQYCRAVARTDDARAPFERSG